MTDDHHLLARYRRNVTQARILHTHTIDNPAPLTEARQPYRDPVDAIRLRGIPCMAPGVGSTIRGTAPHTLPFLPPDRPTI